MDLELKEIGQFIFIFSIHEKSKINSVLVCVSSPLIPAVDVNVNNKLCQEYKVSFCAVSCSETLTRKLEQSQLDLANSCSFVILS